VQYSIVIPVHNEAEFIEDYVTQFYERLLITVRQALAEIILVENGSSDGSMDACERLKNRYLDLIKVFSIKRASYGEAIKRGMLESKGTHLSILECDVLDPGFVAESINLFLLRGAQFIVASKRHPDSIDNRPLKRRLLTWGFNLMLNMLTGYPGTDTHGLKSIETKLAKKLCTLSQTSDELFQSELVLLAWRLGYQVYELPIHIEEKRTTPVSIIRRFPKVMKMIIVLRRSIKRVTN
jgi:dolichyl-phosphate beta-glucosyltransferase